MQKFKKDKRKGLQYSIFICNVDVRCKAYIKSFWFKILWWNPNAQMKLDREEKKLFNTALRKILFLEMLHMT
jgi:hypothetical protein